MSKRKTDSGNLKFAAFFLIFVGGIITLSLIFRAFFLLKESKFNGSSHFTLQISRERETQFIYFSPKDSTIGILNVQNVSSLEIPVDAKVGSSLIINAKNMKSSLSKMLFDLNNQKDINFVDIFRLLLFSQTVKESSISQILITDKTDKVKVDSIMSTFFIDPQIRDEKLSIEIVNASNVYGLGNRLANLISNMGGNVILVSTGDLKEESVIQYNEDGYTVEKLNSVLDFRKEKVEKKSLSDIIIRIGRDYVR